MKAPTYEMKWTDLEILTMATVLGRKDCNNRDIDMIFMSDLCLPGRKANILLPTKFYYMIARPLLLFDFLSMELRSPNFVCHSFRTSNEASGTTEIAEMAERCPSPRD